MRESDASGASPAREVLLGTDVRRVMREHAEASASEECVGALLGRGAEVQVALPLHNSARERARAFELSAAEYLRAEREAEQHGLELLGFFHSHPDGSAVASARDLEHARAFRVGIIVPMRDGSAQAPVVFHSRRE